MQLPDENHLMAGSVTRQLFPTPYWTLSALEGPNLIFQVNDQTVKTYQELRATPVSSASIEVSSSGHPTPAQTDFANFIVMPLP